VHATLPILAADDQTPKVVFAIAIFVIWGISALISWVNKQQQEAKRRQVRQELERASRYRQQQQPIPQPTQRRVPRIAEGLAQRFPDVLLPPNPAPPPLPQQRRPMPPTSRPTPVRRPPKAAAPRRVVPLPPPPLEEVARPQPVIAPAITRPVAPMARRAPTVDAAAIAQWLTPATLRKQFILTEVLQPPLAMRPDRDERDKA